MESQVQPPEKRGPAERRRLDATSLLNVFLPGGGRLRGCVSAYVHTSRVYSIQTQQPLRHIK